MKLLKRIILNKTLFGALIVILFWLILHIFVNSRIIPGIFETAAAFFKLMSGNLIIHISASLLRIILAVVISIFIGVPLGLWTGTNKNADSVISPVAYILYPIPKIAFLPVLILLLGLGESSKIILIITIIVFPILLAARDGVREIPLELFYSVKSLGLNDRQIYSNLVFPAVLPKILSSLRISIGIGISVLFFAENYATSYGIGYFIMRSWTAMNYVEMFAGILALSLTGMMIFRLMDLLERKLCPWIFIIDQVDE